MTARKNRGNRDWRADALFALLLLMMAAAAVSRGALSMSIVLFVSLALPHKNFFAQARRFVTTPFLLSVSLLFFVPFVSGLWSNDVGKWSDVVRIKLPLLFFPLAFAGNWQLTQRRWAIVAAFFLALLFGGCAWGLFNYAQNTTQIHEGYLRAKPFVRRWTMITCGGAGL